MALKFNLKDKMENKFGNEVLGDLGFEEIEEPKKEVKPEVTKQTKKKVQKPLKIPKTDDVEEIVPPQKSKPTGEKRDFHPILDILGIRLKSNLDNLITPEDIEDLTFPLTAPTGLDPDKVRDFCDSMQRDLVTYLTIISNREEDLKKLVGEIVRLEQKLVEQKQESDLASFMTNQQSATESLKEELYSLRIENEKLKEELIKLNKEKELQSNKTLAEVENSVNYEPPKRPRRSVSMSVSNESSDISNNNERDIFLDMLNDL